MKRKRLQDAFVAAFIAFGVIWVVDGPDLETPIREAVAQNVTRYRSRGRARTYVASNETIARTAVHILPTWGDSKSVGVDGTGSPVTSVLSTTDWILCQTGATNEYERLHEDNGSNCWPNAETRGSGMAQELRDRANPPASIITVRCGQAGAQLDLNYWDESGAGAGALYTQCLARIDEAITHIEANPTDFGITAQDVTDGNHLYIHGGGIWIGANSDLDTEADFETDLGAMIDAFATAVETRTGQAARGEPAPQWVVNTPATWAVAGSETTPTGPVLGAIDVAAARSDVYLGPPDYAELGETVSSFVHEQGPNHRRGAQLAGQILTAAVYGGALIEAPLMVSAHTDGTSAWFVFDQNVAIQNGTATQTLGTGTGGASATYGCAAHPGGSAGIELANGTPPTLSGCSATSNVVTCSISALPSVATDARYAWTGTAGTGAFGCQGSSSNPHGNIRNADLMYAQHTTLSMNLDGGGATTPDAGTPDSGTPDAGPSDSGVNPDGAVTDGGIYYMVYGQGQSWGDPASVYGSAVYTTAYQRSDDAGPGAYYYDEHTGSARQAYEVTDAGPGTFLVPTVQTIARGLDLTGSPAPVGLVWDAFPGIATDLQNTTNLTTWDDSVDTDIQADYPGACAWPVAYLVGGGGYQMHSTDPFSDWTTATSTYLGNVRTSASSLANVCGDWTTGDMELLFTGGSHQAWAGADNVYVQHRYNATGFPGHVTAAQHYCGQLYHVGMGTDQLHPQAGANGSGAIADVWAECVLDVIAGGVSNSMQVTDIRVVDVDTLSMDVFVPCIGAGNCADDPPIVYDTTNFAEQTSLGDVVTGGLHFLNDGGLQTPGPLTAVTLPNANACDAGVCTVTLDFDGGIGHFDEIQIANWAEGPDAGAGTPGMGGTNFRARTTETYLNNPDGGPGHWLRSGSVSVVSYDGGTPDAGTADAGTADAGTADSGAAAVFANAGTSNLDDSDDYYQLTGGLTTLDSVSTFTLCFWDREGTRGVNEYLLGEYTASNRKFAFFSRISNYYFYLTSGTGTGERSETTSGVYSNATTQQTCVVFDGGQTGDANRLRWYVTDHTQPCNSSCQETLTFTGSVPATTTAPSSGNFYIGAATSAAASWGSATSYVDEITVWTSALTAAQINEVMNGAANDHSATFGTVPAASHCWRFETSGNRLVDSCGSTDLSSANGTPTIATAPTARPVPNTQFYDPSSNADYLSLAAGTGGTSQVWGGVFDFPTLFESAIDQWATNNKFWLGQNPSTTAVCAVGSGIGREFNTAITTGVEYHMTCVYQSGGTPTLDVYLNGVLDNGTLNGTLPASLNANETFNIGMSSNTQDVGTVYTIDLPAATTISAADACDFYCLTRSPTLPAVNGACDCGAVNVDEDTLCSYSGATNVNWWVLDGDLTNICGGTSLTDNDTANYTSY